MAINGETVEALIEGVGTKKFIDDIALKCDQKAVELWADVLGHRRSEEVDEDGTKRD